MSRMHKSGLHFLGAALAVLGGLLACTPGFRVTSADLPEGQPFARRHIANEWGCHGGNESPALTWTGAPAGTRSFAVTMYDPNKPPVSGWWHWIVYDLPATTTGLPRNAGAGGGTGLPAGAKQGLPDGGAPQPHYYGPCPDAGDPAHRYVITVYALKVEHLEVPATATAADLDYLANSKMISKTSFVRLYQRSAAGG
jgi:Raf kinase inhibitor-like YbhB/YbcL family protein